MNIVFGKQVVYWLMNYVGHNNMMPQAGLLGYWWDIWLNENWESDTKEK